MNHLVIEAEELTYSYVKSPKVSYSTNPKASQPTTLEALDGFNFKVPKGSVYGLLGRNGSGKSTLVKTLFGLLKPDHGNCEVLGLNPIQDVFALRSQVGYLPQDSDFDPQMTVHKTLKFIAPFFEGRWNAERVTQDLARFGLSDHMEFKVGDLSVGQRQRLALVSALAFEPEVLLLDEPTAGLDAVARRDFMEMLIEFMAQEHRTLLVSSHLLNEVERLADHVGIIDSGTLLLETSVELLKRCFFPISFSSDQENDLHWHDLLPNLLTQRYINTRWHLLVYAQTEEGLHKTLKALRLDGAQDISTGESSLESLFVELVEADTQSPFGHRRIRDLEMDAEGF